MNRRPELCRNFQRGSCHYGSRCKFLHPTQQQSSNPYGFGVQNLSQPKSGFSFGANNQNQQKASERGSHFLPLSGAGSLGSRQNDSQSQLSIHTCTDPNICKKQIIEDFKNEQPLWKLTCYGHWKYLPCDITGDISYEELRFSAYEDSKRGLPLQQIVQKEENLFNLKVEEFNSLLRSPYKIPGNSSRSGFVSSSAPFSIPSESGFPSNTTASIPSVGPFGSTAGGGYQPSAGFGNTSSLFNSGFGNTLPAVGSQAQNPNHSPFGNASAFPTNPPIQQSPNSSSFNFGIGNAAFGIAGPSPSQGASQNPFGDASSMKSFNLQNSGNSFSNNPFPSAATNLTISNFGNQSGQAPNTLTGPQTLPGTSGQPFMNITPMAPLGSEFPSNLQISTQSRQDNIWLKSTWNVGEIPEDEPPPYAR